MSITITAKNSDFEFDIGYGTFAWLRVNIALMLDKEFGENYKGLLSCHSKEDFKFNDKKADAIIEKNKLNEKYKDIIDFLYMCDCGGSISVKTCRKLLKVMENPPARKKWYGKRPPHVKKFKDLLTDCIKRKRRMIWW